MSGWTAIIPVKAWALAKSRLRVGDDDRTRLARAFCLDVLDVVVAADQVDRVVVVTAEPELGTIARRAGAAVIVDPPMLAQGQLNRAIDSGRRWAQIQAPSSPLVVVPGDLAALTAGVLDETLRLLAAQERSFVPDASGAGTTLLGALRPELLVSAYGPRSARRHAAAGWHRVSEADVRARHDIDTAADLAEARHLGVGPHTAAVGGRYLQSLWSGAIASSVPNRPAAITGTTAAMAGRSPSGTM